MNKIIKISLLAIILNLIACNSDTPKQEENKDTSTLISDRTDYHSYAQPEKAVTTHLNLNLKVDFAKKQLKGFAQYQIKNNQAKQIIFDTRTLDIEKVTIGKEEKETKFSLSETAIYKGAALKVDIEPSTDLVTIYYSTLPDGADAVDWLEPGQTADKEHPFLFTQGQAILTRTWIPCQDSPGIRITYEATIEVPKDLMAVMSASNPQEKNDSGVYQFEMRQPIPPYLLALAVGDLEFAPIGERTGIYAEPSMIEKSVYEFADMEKMLIAAEGLYGPYLWDRYDVIILPPSFPFGGMENPRLTFATPTIIAGDRSLTSLIAHELAHSWSGNLVTNATWDDFWLNEGFTVYFERRIMEALYGKDYKNMLALLGYQDLEASIQDLEAKDTHLKLHLKDRDPDDGMTDIAYEKGSLFLTSLEEKAGRENFDQFLKTYFEEYKFKTITTEEFISYLQKNLIDKYQLEVNFKDWIYNPAIPEGAPKPQSDRFAKVEAEIKKVTSGTAPDQLTTADWSTHEWLHFIRHLPKELEEKSMSDIDQTFDFSDSGNTEILNAWYDLAIRNGYSKEILPKIEAFLINVGRRKFLTPLYRAFKETGQLETARAIYEKARGNYHSVSRNSMESLLELNI